MPRLPPQLCAASFSSRCHWPCGREGGRNEATTREPGNLPPDDTLFPIPPGVAGNKDIAIMTSRSIRTAAKTTQTAARSTVAAFAAILLGSFVLYGVGFAQPQQVHDAAHDARHSFAFPCH